MIEQFLTTNWRQKSRKTNILNRYHITNRMPCVNIGQKMGQKSLIKRDNADNMYICSG